MQYSEKCYNKLIEVFIAFLETVQSDIIESYSEHC